MTSHDFLVKWTVYTVALLPVWFLEAFVLNRLPFFGIVPMLLPLAAVTVAALEGSASGGAYGLAVGILCDALYGSGGAMTISLTLICVGAGLVAQYALRPNLAGCFACGLGGLLIIDLGRIALRLIQGRAALEPMLRVAGLEIVWSLVFLPLVYLVFRWVHSRTQFATLF